MNRFGKLSFASLLEKHGRWEVEYDTGRRYISHNYMTFWESGRVDMCSTFDNRPDERALLARETSIEIFSSNDTLPVKLRTPDGKVVPKAWFTSQTMLLIDHYAGLVLNAGYGYNGQVSWINDTAFPSGMVPLRFTFPDKAAEEVIWKGLFDERWHEAQVLKELDGLPESLGRVECMLDCERQCKHDWVLHNFACMTKVRMLDRYVRPHTGVPRGFEFLRYEGK